MTTDQFALWKFKTTEGKLENFYSHDFTCTRFTRNFETFLIHYDVPNLLCKIENMSKLNWDPVVVPFKDLVAKLTEMGVYKERTTNRNQNSYIPYTGPVEK